MAEEHSACIDALERLGSRRLANLLADLAVCDPITMAAVDLALAEGQGTEQLVATVTEQVGAISRLEGFLSRYEASVLQRKLDLLRDAIRGPLAEADVEAAVEKMWSLLRLAESVFENAADGDDWISGLFETAVADLAGLYGRTPILDLPRLVERTRAAVDADAYGITKPSAEGSVRGDWTRPRC